MRRSVPVAIASFTIGAGVLMACGDDTGRPALSPTPTLIQATSTAASSAVPTAIAQVATAPPPAGPSPIDGPPRVEVTGLFTDPRASSPAIARRLASVAPSFSPWDGTSTMLYDTGAGTETNLGPGSVGRFSPDGGKLVWIADPQPPNGSGQAMLLDIATGSRRWLGTALSTFFVDDSQVYLAILDAGDDGAHCRELDLTTGEQTPRTCSPGGHGARTTPDGYALYGGNGGPLVLTDGAGQLLLRFDADRAMPAGPGALLIATTPIEMGQRDAEGRFTLASNLFLVDIASGAATFIATANATTTEFMQLPLAANERYIAWTDNYCGGGTTYLFDRQAGDMYDLGQTLWPREFTPDGLLAEGAFGVRTLIDVATPAYRVVLPGGEPQWSPDWRYASIGRVGGHGGLCP